MTRCFVGGTVVTDLKSQDKYQAISELIQSAEVFSRFEKREKIVEAVISRERIHSTGLGRGVAIAHGTTSEVRETLIALGVSEKGIEFNAIDGVPVHLLFIIVHPPKKQMEYLAALATVTRLVRDESFRQAIRAMVSNQELERMICKAFYSCLHKYHDIPV